MAGDRSLLRVFGLLAVGAILTIAALRGADLAAPRFVLPPTQDSADSQPRFSQQLLPARVVAPSVHAATVVALPDGDLLAAWFGGSHEGARDVHIYLSREHAGQWSRPRAVAGRISTQHDTLRFTRMTGNPVLFFGGDGRLYLIYVTVSIGGWAGSALNEMVSSDDGVHWSPARRLITTPMFNISTLVKESPAMLTDGSVALPVYNESMGIFGEWLRLGPHGRLLHRYRIDDGSDSLQPALVPVGPAQAFAYMRYAGPAPNRILMSGTRDGGRSWSAPQRLKLANPNSAVAALRLSNGQILMAYNAEPNNRSVLALALSDDGIHFTRVATLASSPNSQAEFSYPYMIQRGGRVDIVYTWWRRRIAHASFNVAWLEAQARAARKDPSSALKSLADWPAPENGDGH
jgi:predicted neuraminidase